jgi:hypothetical protein
MQDMVNVRRLCRVVGSDVSMRMGVEPVLYFFRLRKRIPASTVIRTIYSQVTKPSSQTARVNTLPDPKDRNKSPNHKTTIHLIRTQENHGDTQNNTNNND